MKMISKGSRPKRSPVLLATGSVRAPSTTMSHVEVEEDELIIHRTQATASRCQAIANLTQLLLVHSTKQFKMERTRPAV